MESIDMELDVPKYEASVVTIPKFFFKCEELITNHIKGVQVFNFVLDDSSVVNLAPLMEHNELIKIRINEITLEKNKSSIYKSMKDEIEVEISNFHFSIKMVGNLKE
jgi:hypothetical protein